MGNSDAHLKNWTLTYPNGRQARLSPAYDLVCITCYDDFRDAGLAFHLGGEKNFGAVMRRHFEVLAAGAGLGERRVLDVVDGTVHALLESWPAIRRESPAPDFVLRHIDDRLRTLPLFSGR
jgi:serine/threonine-protein kinase HipA